ncbi:hypothetical protein H4R20_006468 [Coemansia guatemalensis]|uniref:Mediator of RNA polymerase II transcription subunit 21 n=1 Tax=Coemansia guatemalensis TaxID=2761395 RepID=A0A9W8HVV3_9FUNG|nr:hypothetical protein H4R20_006468 [Coemansia guatemalensis]
MDGMTARGAGSHVDRVTQLQDSADEQCKMLFSSLHYLHKKAGMVQVSPEIPITQQNEGADSASEFSLRTKDIATDICRQAKKIDALIESLPGVAVSESNQSTEFDELNKENEVATRELHEAGQRARALLDRLSRALRDIAESSGKA